MTPARSPRVATASASPHERPSERSPHPLLIRPPLLLLTALVLVACAPREPPAPVPAPATTPVTAPATTPATAPVTAPAPSASPPPPPEPLAIESPAPVEPKPSEPLTPSKTWPFVVWDRAEAFTFNHLLYGPGVPLRVWDASGWSPKIVDRKPITLEQATHAVEWVVATRGDLEVSKCAFPRHAVVLYAGDTPVGSANVCFECGDILVWPAFEAPATGPAAERRHNQQMKAYKRVFPQWQRFFRDELGFPLTPPPQN